ncbi:MAG: proline dehydrogenase family protein [Bryobacteraceae bacterium]|nr:proline dehydrogenase family protein [Bryobacteraceae bacterium]
MLRGALLFLSRRKSLRAWVETSRFARKLTRRFVAGETLEEGLAVCARLNQEGILATLDHLGENVSSIEEGARTRDAYLAALDAIAERRLQSTVSIKLTHFGLDFSEEICRRYVEAVVALAHRYGNAVEIDMESAGYVDRTLDVVVETQQACGCVRAVIQAYLRRSENDIRDLCRRRVPVRLCKGAYKEPPEIAFPRKRDVDANYLRLAGILLEEGVNPAFATHDERIIAEVIRRVRDRRLAPEGLEFQMLYGIRKSLQRQLVRDGFRVRLYVPYGVAWYPYFMRRLAERPANLVFLLRNLARR